ncbi:MAG TPA: hypothetical protein VHO29_15165 [Marmoricola sp.]|nr:hypothetical protein [Marmoricola sp.]
MDQLKNHIAPFVVFGSLGLWILWYVLRSTTAWRRDGHLGVRNRWSWMPLGSTVTTVLGLVRGDPTDDRPVHQLKNPAVVASWLVVCAAAAVVVFYAAVSFLRFGHGL